MCDEKQQKQKGREKISAFLLHYFVGFCGVAFLLRTGCLEKMREYPYPMTEQFGNGLESLKMDYNSAIVIYEIK